MAYVKTVWETGDVITAEKLNNMEGGIEALEPLICHVSMDGVLDKTWQEIYDKLAAGGRVIDAFVDETTATTNMILDAYNYNVGEYKVKEYVISDSGVAAVEFMATSADGYPQASTP